MDIRAKEIIGEKLYNEIEECEKKNMDDEEAHSSLYIHIVPKEINSKHVYQFTKKGELVKEYSKLADACRQTGLEQNSIWLCLQGKMYSAGGFCWSYESHMDKEYVNPNWTAVQQFSLNNEFLNEYPSITKAAKSIGCNIGNIQKCIRKNKGRTENFCTSRGFIWKRKAG